MRLLLIRHAIAEDREKLGGDDARRPLTPDGKRKMKIAARGLRTVCPKIDILATSPLVRAVQTAEIVYRAFDEKPQFVELDFLSGDGGPPAALLQWARDHDADGGTLAAVGHEPDLGRWAGWFLTGKEQPIVKFKKGAACALDFPGRLAGGKAVLEFLLQPGELRKLAR